MVDDRWWRAAARTYRWMLAGMVAALVYELIHIEAVMWLKILATVVSLLIMFGFGTALEFWIQSAIDPDVTSGWGPE